MYSGVQWCTSLFFQRYSPVDGGLTAYSGLAGCQNAPSAAASTSSSGCTAVHPCHHLHLWTSRTASSHDYGWRCSVPTDHSSKAPQSHHPPQRLPPPLSGLFFSFWSITLEDNVALRYLFTECLRFSISVYATVSPVQYVRPASFRSVALQGAPNDDYASSTNHNAATDSQRLISAHARLQFS